jgi:serine phosphatase RsbU (regulator of sigma subunit)
MIELLPSILQPNEKGENIKNDHFSISDQSLINYFSSFPTELELRKLIKNSFVINRPMTGVGGDGYWLHYTQNDLFVIIFDCMGHGRLAAMMTRIYLNTIKKIIIEKKILDPGSILNAIHEEIKSIFKNKDGMLIGSGADVAVLKIDTIDKKMYYSGAKIDLVTVNDSEIVRTKAHRRQVGSFFQTDRTYETDIFDINDSKITSIYLFSDGLTDLIGGPEDRKLTLKLFETILVKIKGLSMELQKKEIEKLIESWQGINSQVDDILVLGITF